MFDTSLVSRKGSWSITFVINLDLELNAISAPIMVFKSGSSLKLVLVVRGLSYMWSSVPPTNSFLLNLCSTRPPTNVFCWILKKLCPFALALISAPPCNKP